MFLFPGEEVHAFLFEQFVLFLFKRKTNIRLVEPILVPVFHVRLEALGPGHVVIGLWEIFGLSIDTNFLQLLLL